MVKICAVAGSGVHYHNEDENPQNKSLFCGFCFTTADFFIIFKEDS